MSNKLLLYSFISLFVIQILISLYYSNQTVLLSKKYSESETVLIQLKTKKQYLQTKLSQLTSLEYLHKQINQTNYQPINQRLNLNHEN